MTSTLPASAPTTSLTFGRLVVLVRDYDEALAFYKDAFGATVLFDEPAPQGERYLHVGLAGDPAAPGGSGSTPAGLWLLRARSADAAYVGRQTGGHPIAVLYTADVRASVARAEAAGAAVVRPLTTADGATFAHVADLYGNEFVLVQLPPV